MSLSDEERRRFIPIIDSILVAADLQTISEKRIRKGLQIAIDDDLTEKKDAVKELIMARFDIVMASQKNEPLPPPPQTNGHAVKHESPTPPSTANHHDTSTSPPPPSKKHKQEELSDSLSSVIDSPKPKKKRKIENEDSDAAYAAKLQALENSRSRSTRGGGAKSSKAKPVKKKTPKKKSSNKIGAEDDSDLDGSGSGEGKERKVNRNTGFHKELMLSSALSALLDNEIKLSRPQTVKRIWQYVRAHDLQDPMDKRMIRCDDAMRAVFKQDKIHMFTMNKILNQNLYPADE